MRLRWGGLLIAVTPPRRPQRRRHDRNGFEQIAAGDLVRAQRLLEDERRMFPRATDVLLNLAAVYARTGRLADADSLYRQVAAAPDEMLEMPDGGDASAHALAQAGLTRVAAPASSDTLNRLCALRRRRERRRSKPFVGPSPQPKRSTRPSPDGRYGGRGVTDPRDR